MTIGVVPWVRATLLVAIAMIGLGAGPAPGMSRQPLKEPSPPSDDRPLSAFEDVSVAGEDRDGTVWRLEAERGRGRETERSGTLEEVRVAFRKNDTEMVLDAGLAEIHGGEGFHLSDGVVLSWDEFEARLEDATYEKGQGVITSGGNVVFEGRGLKLTGRGVEVEIGSRVVRIREAASARFEGDDT